MSTPIEAPTPGSPELGPPLALALISLSLAVGLASYLVVLQGLWVGTRNEDFRSLRRGWGKVFAWELLGAAACVGWFLATGPLGLAWKLAGDGFPYRTVRLGLAAVLATALLVGGVSALRLWRDPDDPAARQAIRMTVGMLVICAPLEFAFTEGAAAPTGAAIGLQGAVLALGLWGAVLCLRDELERSRAFLCACMAGGLLGLAMPLAAWLHA